MNDFFQKVGTLLRHNFILLFVSAGIFVAEYLYFFHIVYKNDFLNYAWISVLPLFLIGAFLRVPEKMETPPFFLINSLSFVIFTMASVLPFYYLTLSRNWMFLYAFNSKSTVFEPVLNSIKEENFILFFIGIIVFFSMTALLFGIVFRKLLRISRVNSGLVLLIYLIFPVAFLLLVLSFLPFLFANKPELLHFFQFKSWIRIPLLIIGGVIYTFLFSLTALLVKEMKKRNLFNLLLIFIVLPIMMYAISNLYIYFYVKNTVKSSEEVVFNKHNSPGAEFLEQIKIPAWAKFEVPISGMKSWHDSFNPATEAEKLAARDFLVSEEYKKFTESIEKLAQFEDFYFGVNTEKWEMTYLMKSRIMIRLLLGEAAVYHYYGEKDLVMVKLKQAKVFTRIFNHNNLLIEDLVRLALDSMYISMLVQIAPDEPKYLDFYSDILKFYDNLSYSIADDFQVFRPQLQNYVENLEIKYLWGDEKAYWFMRPAIAYSCARYFRQSREEFPALKDAFSQMKHLDYKLKYPYNEMFYNAMLKIKNAQNLNATLAALKFYRVKNGEYPENLTPLEKLIAPEKLLNPYTMEKFEYRKSGSDFFIKRYSSFNREGSYEIHNRAKY